MPAITGESVQKAIRFKKDTYGLMEKDAKKVRGVSTVVNRIVEKHYEPRLKKMRTRAKESSGKK